MVIEMKTMILSIGNEITSGFVQDTNATYFSSKLHMYGFDILKRYTLTDDFNDISNCIKSNHNKYDLVIVSGGLGPTNDDITKEAIADALGLELVLNEEVLANLKQYFLKRNYPYTNVNDKQCYFSKLDHLLINNRGTAHGYYFTLDKTTYCVLPGPPIENNILFDEFLTTLIKEDLYERSMYLTNIGESQAQKLIEHLIEKYNKIMIGCYMQDYGIIYRFNGPQDLVDECFDEFKLAFNEYYLTDQNDYINEIIDILIKNNLTISSAESCTGGLLASTLTNYSGVSSIFKESIVTYSNEAKIKYLDVSKNTLNNYGAVSKECANEMSLGLYKQTNSNICISITGIAGPDGGSELKPVGTVYFSILYNNKNYEYHQVFNGMRNQVRVRATKYILSELLRLIK